jgi:hypothetical protein
MRLLVRAINSGSFLFIDTLESVIRTEGSEYCQRRLTVFSRWHHSEARMPSCVHPTPGANV